MMKHRTNLRILNFNLLLIHDYYFYLCFNSFSPYTPPHKNVINYIELFIIGLMAKYKLFLQSIFNILRNRNLRKCSEIVKKLRKASIVKAKKGRIYSSLSPHHLRELNTKM